MATLNRTKPEVHDLKNIREQIVGYEMEVPLLNGKKRRYINFDNAASTPVLRPVLKTINEFMRWYSSIHRGTGFKSQLCSEIYDEVREIVADFVNVDSSTHAVMFGKNTTEAVNKLARRFPLTPDSVVLVSKMEHHSNDLPWRSRCSVHHVEIDELGRLSEEDLLYKLKSFGRRVALVSVTGASNVTGWVNDVNHLAAICHAHGVPIMVDAAQLAPHRKIDMRDPSDPGHIDFLAFSAHKLYAPFGTGVLIGDKSLFETGAPDIVGGGAVDVVTLERVVWNDPPEREEAGSPNVVGAVALGKVLRVLEQLGMDNIARHEGQLTKYALTRMKKIPGVQIYGGTNPKEVANRMGVITFNVKGLKDSQVASILNYEGGIGVRHGCFCAHPYIKQLLGVTEEESHQMEMELLRKDRSNLPGAVRISFGIYNSEEEIDIFLDTLAKIARREWKGDYLQDVNTGQFHPRGYHYNFAEYFSLT